MTTYSFYTLAFVCHHNVFPIFKALKQPSESRFGMVTHFSMGISLIICLTMGIGGYIFFTDKTQGKPIH
jgi:sodium-coupled neutral amino acid transporter 11